MDHEAVSDSTNTVPRIKVFGVKRITASIRADCLGLKGATAPRLFGRG